MLPKAQFVFIGLPHASEAERRLMERLRAAFVRRGLDARDHVVLLPRLSKARFFGALAQADLLLDSPGWSGCNSTLESLGAALPMVTLEGELMRGRHTAAFLRRLGLERLIARDLDGYVATALGLGADPALRLRIRREIEARRDGLYGDEAPIRAMEDVLERLVEERRAAQQRH